MTIAEIVQCIMDGRGVPANVALLQKDRRKAIAYLLSVLEGGRSLVQAEGVDGRDAHDNLAGALFQLGREDVGHLVALLRAELQHNRMQPAFSLAWALAHLDDRAALDVMMTAVRHRDAYVRWAACIGLRRLHAEEARALLNAAAADRSSLVRSEAVEALEQQGDTSSLPVLTKRLHDRYPGIQLAARQAISAIERRTASKQGGLS